MDYLQQKRKKQRSIPPRLESFVCALDSLESPCRGLSCSCSRRFLALCWWSVSTCRPCHASVRSIDQRDLWSHIVVSPCLCCFGTGTLAPRAPATCCVWQLFRTLCSFRRLCCTLSLCNIDPSARLTCGAPHRPNPVFNLPLNLHGDLVVCTSM